MQVYFFVDHPDLGDKEAEFIAELIQWVEEHKEHASLVND